MTVENDKWNVMLERLKVEKMETEETHRIVKDLKAARDSGELDTQPHFQRNAGVWDDTKKSWLLESIWENMPIPQIYVAEAPKAGKKGWIDEVVDGQQRLTTVFDFMDGKFKLKGLTKCEDANKTGWDDLPLELQDRIKNYPFRVIKVLRTSDPDVKYDLFMRLNMGSVGLNKQEIRECFYYGPAVELVRELAMAPVFNAWMIEGISKQKKIRRQAEEYVVEALAFHVLPDDAYRRKAPFIDTFYQKCRDERMAIDDARFQQWRVSFKAACETIATIFGNYPFRDLADPPGYHSPRRFLDSVYRIYMYTFMKVPDHALIRTHAREIFQAVKELFKEKDFLFTITSRPEDEMHGTRSTTDIYKVRKGLDMFNTLIKQKCKGLVPKLPYPEREQAKAKKKEVE